MRGQSYALIVVGILPTPKVADSDVGGGATHFIFTSRIATLVETVIPEKKAVE